METTQILILLAVAVTVCIVVLAVRKRRPKGPSKREESLRQDLRRKVLYDEGKIDRLIDFERAELAGRGQRDTSVEVLMERAIARWERDNR